MSIDGFLQFLGLVVAVYALLNVVIRYRLRLLGWRLWLPTLVAISSSIYLLLFDVIGLSCSVYWCAPFVVVKESPVTPNILAFLIVLTWLVYVVLLSQRTSISARNLPLLAALVDRLVSEKRFPEVVDVVEPHASMIAKVAGRELYFRQFRDRIRMHGNPFLRLNLPFVESEDDDNQNFWIGTRDKLLAYCMNIAKYIESKIPETSNKEYSAQRILRVFHAHEPIVEYISLERPLFALNLMNTKSYDFEFSDRVFEHMMAHQQSPLRRETILNQNVEQCFYEIDPKNAFISALFSDTKVAEKLEVYRPVGNYPLGLLDRNEGNYRQTISSAKPSDDRFIERDPTYCMIRFFDIMIRSAMRDGIEWHMWLLYYDTVVRKLIASIDFDHPDFDRNAEFPNFAFYLIYEIFSAYGSWFQAIKCCPADSPVVQIEKTAPVHANGSILKTTMLSVGNSLAYLLKSEETPDEFITYILEMIMRDYRDLAVRKNGGPKAQLALSNAILSGGIGGRLQDIHLARLDDCYREMDHVIQYETQDFKVALQASMK